MKTTRYLLLTEKELKQIINETAANIKISNAIIEKDLWVCIILDYLFNDFKYKDSFVFKGGTSLSKAYNIIERFSEDIDLVLDWTILGYQKDEPYEHRSNTKQEKFNLELNDKTAIFLHDEVLPILEKDFKILLKNKKFKFYIEPNEPLVIGFCYPKYYRDTTLVTDIRLEIGALAQPIPYITKDIKLYISYAYPKIFNEKIRIRVLDSLRTFYEKLTIIHREANRINKNYPKRYSRHFYDVYKMLQTDLRERSLIELDLLKSVIEFKKKFYKSNWAKYDEIYCGNLKLVPLIDAINIFQKDYDDMKLMLFGDIVSFNTIINELKEYEKEINKAIKTKFKSN